MSPSRLLRNSQADHHSVLSCCFSDRVDFFPINKDRFSSHELEECMILRRSQYRAPDRESGYEGLGEHDEVCGVGSCAVDELDAFLGRLLSGGVLVTRDRLLREDGWPCLPAAYFVRCLRMKFYLISRDKGCIQDWLTLLMCLA